MSRSTIPTARLGKGLAAFRKGRYVLNMLGWATRWVMPVIPALVPPTDLIEVPVVGQVAAGEPILAEENVSDTVHVDSFFLGGTTRRVFALRVVGESMIEDGIFDGDYIFVKKQLTANRGEIVVAMIEGDATVKRYYPEGDRIRFQPANEAMEPIYVSRDEFRDTQIIGVVCGVYRRVH